MAAGAKACALSFVLLQSGSGRLIDVRPEPEEVSADGKQEALCPPPIARAAASGREAFSANFL